MKKKSLIIASLLSFTSIAWAAETIWIHQLDNIALGLDIKSTENITLSNDGSTVNFNLKDNAGTHSLNYSEIQKVTLGKSQNAVTIAFNGTDAEILNPYGFDGVTVTRSNSNVTINSTATEEVRYEISGVPAEDYVTTGEITYGVTEVKLMGKASTLSRISEIVVKGEEVSIEGSEESVVLNLDLDNYLPSGIYRTDRTVNDGRVSVEIEVVPIIEKEFTLLAKQVTLKNIPDKHFADRTLDTAEFTVTIRGAQHHLEELDSTKIKGTIDISAWMEANNFKQLGVGTVYRIVPEFDLGEDFEVIDSEAIEVAAGIVEEE